MVSYLKSLARRILIDECCTVGNPSFELSPSFTPSTLEKLDWKVSEVTSLSILVKSGEKSFGSLAPYIC